MNTLYSLSQAADVLGVHPHIIAYLLSTKKLPEPMRIGHRRLFNDADLARIKKHLEATAASRYSRGPHA
jgi:DNA-binding transcriptional MerR regulator